MPIKPKTKWKFAMGTTSRVPGTGKGLVKDLNGHQYNLELHYLMADLDTGIYSRSSLKTFLTYLVSTLNVRNIVTQRTENGWHVYTDYSGGFWNIVDILRERPQVDQQWLNIAEKRGYLYLADKDAVILPWPVERMQLHHERRQKKGNN
jgi:hypothetical protein